MFFINIEAMKAKKNMNNCSRLKESKGTLLLNIMYESGLNPRSEQKNYSFTHLLQRTLLEEMKNLIGIRLHNSIMVLLIS